MNSLRALLKATFTNDYGLNGFSKSIANTKEKKKILILLSTMAIGAVAISYVITIFALLMADSLQQSGFLQVILVMGILTSTLLVLFTSIYKAQGSLFTSKDYDLLMSLPIKSSVILTSKLINLLILDWIFTAFAVVPPSIIYFIRVGNLSWMYFLIVIIGIIFIPLIPVILASITAVIISYFASKFRYKNLTTILGTVILVIFIMLGSFYTQSIMDSIAANSSSLMDMIGKVYPPAVYLTNSLTNIDFLELLKFIVISAIPFAIFILIFSKSFEKINSRLGEIYKRANYKMEALKTNSLLKALTYKELKRYFSVPTYVLNTAIGMIMVLIGAVATLFIDGKTLAMYMDLPYANNIFSLMVLGMMIFGIGLSSTTSSSISLEGKNLWIIKSLPLQIKDIFLGKIMLSLIITLPLSILANILFFLGLKLSFVSFSFNIVISSVYCFLTAILGLVINLYFPKMEWASPTSVVKQSASVMITLLATFATIGLPIVAFIIFKVTNFTMFLSIILVVFITILIGLWGVLNKSGVKKFIEL